MPSSPKPAEWGKLARHFDDINESFIDYDEQAAALLSCRERFVPRATRALDLGCATGQHARRLAMDGMAVVGVDISPALVRRARRAVADLEPRPRFLCADLEALPLRRPFDLIYALNFVFSFLHTNQAIRRAVSETRRLLARRGVFVMDYHYFFPGSARDKLLKPWQERCKVGEQTLVVSHSPVVDWDTQLCTDTMVYRFMDGERVVREVESTEVRRISLPQDLRCILELSGLEVLAHCARWDLDRSPEESMGVFVARRKRRT
jgi:SAM-dependent methyltransferase